MSQLGMTDVCSGWDAIDDVDSVATAFPFYEEAPGKSYANSLFSEVIGSWDDPIAPSEVIPAVLHATYAVLDDDNKPTAVWAYLDVTAVTGLGKVAAGVYDEAGNLVAGSAAQLFTVSGASWWEFPLVGAPALVDGTSYCLWVRADYDALNDLVNLSVGAMDEYVEPPDPPGPGPAGATPSGPLLTGSGMF